MDCEGFDESVVDLLYDSGSESMVDEARRHAEGCPRCANLLATLRVGREWVKVPMLSVPDGLTLRILEAARSCEHHRHPWLRRLDQAISLAGSYAMRPQLAMGSLLLLMLGSSFLLLRSRPAGSNAVRVTERGVPLATETPVSSAAMVASVVGPIDRRGAPVASWYAGSHDDKARGLLLAGQDARPKALSIAVEASSGPSALANEALAPSSVPLSQESSGPLGDVPRESASASAPMPPAGASSDAAFSAALEYYKAKRYEEAVHGFDAVFNGGGTQVPAAALYAARAVRYSAGCDASLPRFEAVANRYAGQGVAAEAMWDAALCYREGGHADHARQLYQALRHVAGYRDRAERELSALEQQPSVRAPSLVNPAGGLPRAASPKAKP